MLAEIETALVGRLTKKLGPEIGVEGFPDDPDNYVMRFPQGVALIGYIGSQFAAPKTPTARMQQRVLRWYIQLLLRQWRDHSGSLPVIDLVLDALVSWPPLTDEPYPFFAITDGFEGRSKSLWKWSVQIGIRVPYQPPAAPDTEEDLERVGLQYLILPDDETIQVTDVVELREGD